MFQPQAITWTLPKDHRIQVVVMLMERNPHDQFGIEKMARVVNLSPGRLAHLFKNEMQLSMQQYLTRLRLMKAKEKLESTFLSIKEIAALVGFPSVTRFVVGFKNFAGSTPAQYRKNFPRQATALLMPTARLTESWQKAQRNSRNR